MEHHKALARERIQDRKSPSRPRQVEDALGGVATVDQQPGSDGRAKSSASTNQGRDHLKEIQPGVLRSEYLEEVLSAVGDQVSPTAL